MLTCFSIRFTVVAVIAALAVSAASIPRPRRKGHGISVPLIKHSPSLNSNFNKSVNVNGLKSHAALYTTKLLRGLENYERNTGTTHPYALKRSGSYNWKRGGAAFDLTSHEDGWYGDISMGTPPKPFIVQIDTGISDLFIPSSTGNVYCKSHDNIFNTASSATSKDLDKSFLMEFGDGATVNGKQYTDNITIAGFTADKQTIGVATTYSANLAKDHFSADGVLGLAFQSISKYPASSLFETLISERKLLDGVFSLELNPEGGELYIGGVNEELYLGDITYVNLPARVPGFWQVTVEDIRVNGKLVLTNVPAIIDCGANYIFGDQDRVSKLHQAYGGKAFEDDWYTFPCDHFPDVAFTFGGKPFTIPAHELDFGPVEEGSPDCFSGIVTRSQNDVSFWTIGTIFLQGFYTVFNMDSKPPRIGFAQLKG